MALLNDLTENIPLESTNQTLESLSSTIATLWHCKETTYPIRVVRHPLTDKEYKAGKKTNRTLPHQ